MIEPVRRLELVHFQLTRRCNLHCWFCGQQAENSTFAGRTGGELSLEEWRGVIEDLEEVRQKTGASPSVILWAASRWCRRTLHRSPKNWPGGASRWAW